MTPEQFAYWLQGYSEIAGNQPTPEQWKMIQEHLQTVFHKITGGMPVIPNPLKDINRQTVPYIPPAQPYFDIPGSAKPHIEPPYKIVCSTKLNNPGGNPDNAILGAGGGCGGGGGSTYNNSGTKW